MLYTRFRCVIPVLSAAREMLIEFAYAIRRGALLFIQAILRCLENTSEICETKYRV